MASSKRDGKDCYKRGDVGKDGAGLVRENMEGKERMSGAGRPNGKRRRVLENPLEPRGAPPLDAP